MIAVISLLVVLVVSLTVVRVATVALQLTGLSRELARFQARSAFTGAGFTTSESEKVVHHPVRRRIIMLLMLLGNAGIVTAISSLMLSFVGSSREEGLTGQLWFRMALLIVGLTVLWTLANSRWLDQRMSRLIARALKRWTSIEIRDYAGLLHLTGGYVVCELAVQEGDWLAGQPLADLRLSEEGVLVLGVERPDGNYFGAPRGGTQVKVGDTLLLYGRQDTLQDLDQRSAGFTGNWRHHQAVDQQRQIEAQEAQTQQAEEEASEA